jgi:hypothetical protein
MRLVKKRKMGETRESDNRIFWGYSTEKRADGTPYLYERWYTPEQLKNIKEKHKQWREQKHIKKRTKAKRDIWKSKPETQEKQRIYRLEYYKNNKDSLYERKKEYNNRPESKKLRQIREARYNKSPKKKEKNRNYVRKRRAENIEYALASKVRTRIWYALKRRRATKREKTSKLVGCSFLFLKQHIESQFREGMAWDKPNSFHIDHILPLASFDLTDPEQLKAACHWTNLQPLYPVENMQKGAKILTTTN